MTPFSGPEEGETAVLQQDLNVGAWTWEPEIRCNAAL